MVTVPLTTVALNPAARCSSRLPPAGRSNTILGTSGPTEPGSKTLMSAAIPSRSRPRSVNPHARAGSQGDHADRRSIADISAERGLDPVDTLIDVVVPERLPLSVVFPSLVPSLGVSDESWPARAKVWKDDRVVLGGSDAGAHVDLMCHANYTTVVLGDLVRERELFSIEEAVHLLSDVPARLYGLTGRGRVAEGWHADLVVLDPRLVASEPAQARYDMPAGACRIYAGSRGVAHVLVAGRAVVTAGTLTGVLPGTLLRSGTDTETVTVPGGPQRRIELKEGDR